MYNLLLISIVLFSYVFAVTTEDIYDDSWALIIGINKYENVQKLDFAADDAIAMRDILIKSFNFPEDNVTILLNEEATKDNIVKEFSNVAFKAEEGDRVIVFFAGHGETMELPEGGQMGYLIPVNGDAGNLYYSSIRMEELKSLALMSKAKHMLYLVDACYGGIAAVGSRGLNTNTPNYIDKIISGKSRQIITAGGKGEQVIEKSEWGHSAFTLNLKRGLKDGRADLNVDGYITATELGMFLNEKVTVDSDNQQTPQYGRMTSQEGEFIFTLPRSENIIEEDSESESVLATTESDATNLKEIEEKLDQLLSSQQKVEPIRINKSEFWYYYFKMGYPNYFYPEKLTDFLTDITADITNERLQYNIGLVGIYFHLGEKRIIGANYEYSADITTYDTELQTSFIAKELALHHYFISLSMLSFINEFGNGPFYSIDIGPSWFRYYYTYKDGDYDGDTDIMESGFGSKVGIGYAYSLGGSRIMASVNMYFNFIDLSESTVSILEDFTKYNMLKINLGMLF